jgi:flagellar biogenesis protein FliO
MVLAAGAAGGTAQLILFVLGFLVIIALTYYVTVLVAKGGSKTAQSRAVRVLDRVSLSREKLICLVEVAGKVYLVAMTEGGVSLLDSLGEEAAGLVREQSRMTPPFSDAVQRGLAKGFSAIFDRKKHEAEDTDRDKKDPPEGGSGG